MAYSMVSNYVATREGGDCLPNRLGEIVGLGRRKRRRHIPLSGSPPESSLSVRSVPNPG